MMAKQKQLVKEAASSECGNCSSQPTGRFVEKTTGSMDSRFT